MNPHDKLCAAIGILQSHILASDSLWDAEKLFHNRRMATSALELAESMLAELLPVLDALEAGGVEV